jgi:hypothetical protein
VLFVISNSETAFWLSEVTHPYWHLTERGVEIDFASPQGGKVVFDPYSDPYFEKSTEAEDLVSKGFLSAKKLKGKLETTLQLKDVDLSQYDAIHVAGGRGATFDLFPNEDVAKALEYFWSRDKVRNREGVSRLRDLWAQGKASGARCSHRGCATEEIFGRACGSIRQGREERQALLADHGRVRQPRGRLYISSRKRGHERSDGATLLNAHWLDCRTRI